MPQDRSPDRPEGDRIAKLLARAGIASRREIERMIAEGRIQLNGQPVTTPATILTSLRGVTVDGRPVKGAEPARVFGFHKPDGLITAERDPSGRPTIYTALRNALPPGAPRVMPIGRLDLNTEGLLLLTNDGELKRALELPSSEIPRTYRARTFGDITQNQLEDLMEGIEIGGFRYGPINANMERRTGSNQWIEMTLTEGKNREVRRVLEHLGLQVSRLLRVAYGPFHLGDLQRGSAVEIAQKDVERLRKLLRGGSAERAGDLPVQSVMEGQPTRPERSHRDATPVAAAASPKRAPSSKFVSRGGRDRIEPGGNNPDQGAATRGLPKRNTTRGTERLETSRSALTSDEPRRGAPARNGPNRGAPPSGEPPRPKSPGFGPRRGGPKR